MISTIEASSKRDRVTVYEIVDSFEIYSSDTSKVSKGPKGENIKIILRTNSNNISINYVTFDMVIAEFGGAFSALFYIIQIIYAFFVEFFMLTNMLNTSFMFHRTRVLTDDKKPFNVKIIGESEEEVINSSPNKNADNISVNKEENNDAQSRTDKNITQSPAKSKLIRSVNKKSTNKVLQINNINQRRINTLSEHENINTGKRLDFEVRFIDYQIQKHKLIKFASLERRQSEGNQSSVLKSCNDEVENNKVNNDNVYDVVSFANELEEVRKNRAQVKINCYNLFIAKIKALFNCRKTAKDLIILSANETLDTKLCFENLFHLSVESQKMKDYILDDEMKHLLKVNSLNIDNLNTIEYLKELSLDIIREREVEYDEHLPCYNILQMFENRNIHMRENQKMRNLFKNYLKSIY